MGRTQGPTSGKPENTFLTFLSCYKCKKYSFKKVGATREKTSMLLDNTYFLLVVANCTFFILFLYLL